MQTPVVVSPDPDVSEASNPVSNPVKVARPHGGPVARLLAQVSKSVGAYADYQMDEGVWRKLAI